MNGIAMLREVIMLNGTTSSFKLKFTGSVCHSPNPKSSSFNSIDSTNLTIPRQLLEFRPNKLAVLFPGLIIKNCSL